MEDLLSFKMKNNDIKIKSIPFCYFQGFLVKWHDFKFRKKKVNAFCNVIEKQMVIIIIKSLCKIFFKMIITTIDIFYTAEMQDSL